ncbi:MAG: O-antigen ligase family protein [Geminicoccaceae bacterium]
MLPVSRLERVAVGAGVFLSMFLVWRLGSVFFTVSDLLFTVTFVLLLCTRGLPRQPLGGLTGPWLIAFSLLAFGLIASSVVHGDPLRGLIVSGQYAFSLVILPFLLSARDEETTIFYVKCLVAGIIFVNAFGIVFYYDSYDPTVGPSDLHYISGSGRLQGLVGDPNGNAALIALALPFILFLWMSGQISALLVVPAFGIAIVGLIMSSSVGGLGMSALGVLVFLTASGSFRVLAKTIAGLAVCLLVLFGWAGFKPPQVFETRVMSAFHSGSIEDAGTFHDRMELNYQALDMIKTLTVLGVGADRFREINHYPVHNTYLIVWVEGGVIALAGWLMVLALAFAAALRALLMPGKRLIAALGLSTATVFALIGMSGAHLYGRYWLVPVHLSLSLVLFGTVRRRARRPTELQPAMAPEHGRAQL